MRVGDLTSGRSGGSRFRNGCVRTWLRRSPISCGVSTRSTNPVAMADRGMPSYLARRLGSLGDGDAAERLDLADAGGAVRRRPRQNHADRAVLRPARERLEQIVDRGELAAIGRPRHEMQLAVQDLEMHAGRNHVDVVRLDPHAVRGVDDLERRLCGEEFGKRARMLRRQVQDEDEGDIGLWRDVLEDAREGLESAGRRADRDDRGRELRRVLGGMGLSAAPERVWSALGGGLVPVLLARRAARGVLGSGRFAMLIRSLGRHSIAPSPYRPTAGRPIRQRNLITSIGVAIMRTAPGK